MGQFEALSFGRQPVEVKLSEEEQHLLDADYRLYHDNGSVAYLATDDAIELVRKFFVSPMGQITEAYKSVRKLQPDIDIVNFLRSDDAMYALQYLSAAFIRTKEVLLSLSESRIELLSNLYHIPPVVFCPSTNTRTVVQQQAFEVPQLGGETGQLMYYVLLVLNEIMKQMGIRGSLSSSGFADLYSGAVAAFNVVKTGLEEEESMIKALLKSVSESFPYDSDECGCGRAIADFSSKLKEEMVDELIGCVSWMRMCSQEMNKAIQKFVDTINLIAGRS